MSKPFMIDESPQALSSINVKLAMNRLAMPVQKALTGAGFGRYALRRLVEIEISRR
jgi:hypothetical protein